MSIKARVQKIGRALTCLKRKNALRVEMPTIIGRDCVCGVIYHDLMQRFDSPTINLYIEPREFIVLAKNLEEYTQRGRLSETKEDGISFPIGLLSCEGLADIKIYFMHYSTYAEAEQKWYERCKRINFDNIVIVFACMNETGDMSAVLEDFSTLPYKKVALLNETQPEGQFIYRFKKGAPDREGGENLMSYRKSNRLLQWRYLDHFDYVEFLNSGEIKSRKLK